MSAVLLLITLTSTVSAGAAPALGLVADEALRPGLIQALQQQLPDVDVRLGAPTGRDDRVASVSRSGLEVQLTIRSGDGQLLLERKVPADALLASTCALMVERFLSDSGWPGLESHGITVGPASPPSPRPEEGLALGLGALVTRGLDGGAASSGPELTLWSRKGRLAWSIRAAWRLIPDRPVVVNDIFLGELNRLGTLRGGAASVIASTGLCAGEATFGCLSGRLGAIAAWAKTSGPDLYQQRSAVGVQPTSGFSAIGGFARLPWGLQAQMEISSDFRFGTSRYTVQGVGEVLRAPRLECGLAAKIFRTLR